MKPLPEYVNLALPECRRLSRVLAAMDDKLFCCWNGRTQRYEVWGPSQSEGFAFLSAVEAPDGRTCSPDAYPYHILADLKSRDRDPNMRGVLEENALRVAATWEREMDAVGEYARYVAKAVAAEASGGALRHGANDVLLGLRLAEEGRSKGAPAGQKIYYASR